MGTMHSDSVPEGLQLEPKQSLGPDIQDPHTHQAYAQYHLVGSVHTKAQGYIWGWSQADLWRTTGLTSVDAVSRKQSQVQ